MSGGVAYVYDEDGEFVKRCNSAMVSLEKLQTKEEQQAASQPAGWHNSQTDEAQLRRLVEDHHRWTGSLRAREILDQWAQARGRFVKVLPHEYRRVLSERKAVDDTQATIAKAKAAPAKQRTIPAK